MNQSTIMRSAHRFYSSLGLLIILNLVIKPLWIFAIERQVQNAVGNHLYGTYFSLLNLTLMGGFLLDWGITAWLNRQMAVETRHALSLRYIKILFSVIYTGVILLLGWISGTERWDILILAIVIQVLTSFLLFLRGIVTAQQWFRADAWLSVLDKTIMILVCGCFLYLPAIAGPISLEKFLWAQAGATALAILVSFQLLHTKGFRFSTGRAFTPLPKILKAALPYGIIVLLMTVHYRLDGFLLAEMKNEYEAGVYAAAYRLLDAANMTGYLAASFLLPYIARRRKRGDEFNTTVLDIRHLLMLFSITAVIFTFFLGGEFNTLLYNNPGRASTEVLQWCLPALLGYSLVQVYGTVLTAAGHIVSFCQIALWAVIINALLNIGLIPLAGALGSCAAALISQGFFGLSCFWWARKKCGVSLHPGSWLLYIFIGAALVAALFLFRALELNGIAQAGLGLLIVMVAATTTKLISIKKWMEWPGIARS